MNAIHDNHVSTIRFSFYGPKLTLPYIKPERTAISDRDLTKWALYLAGWAYRDYALPKTLVPDESLLRHL
jgi:hypothetical protein